MGGRYLVLGQVPWGPEEFDPLEQEIQEAVDCPMCTLGTELAAYGATSAAPLNIFQNTVQVSFQDTGTDFSPFHEHTHVSEEDLNAYKGKKRGSMQGECPHCARHRHLVTEGALTQFAAEGGRTDLLLEASINIDCEFISILY